MMAGGGIDPGGVRPIELAEKTFVGRPWSGYTGAVAGSGGCPGSQPVGCKVVLPEPLEAQPGKL